MPARGHTPISKLEVDGNLDLTGVQLLVADGNGSQPGIAFADDPDTGFRREGANTVTFVSGASTAFKYNSTQLWAGNADGPALLNEASSNTNPTIIPDRGSPSSGLGGNGGTVTLVYLGNNLVKLQSTEIVINEGGGDFDFRVESDLKTHMFFVQGGEDNIGVNNSSPDVSALLDLTSIGKGFLPPRMTTTDRDAISSPATGLIIWNTTTGQLEDYNGSVWAAV